MSTVNKILSILKTAAKEGELLFRKEPNPLQLFQRGNMPMRAPVTGTEPFGLYFARDRHNLDNLIMPGISTNQTIDRPTVLGALIHPEKDFDFSKETGKDFIDFVRSAYRNADLRNPAAPYRTGTVEDILANIGLEIDRLEGGSRPYSRAITDYAIKQGARSITFPDFISYQPDMLQTAVLTPGSVAVKYKDKLKILGASGLGVSLSQPEEQTGR